MYILNPLYYLYNPEKRADLFAISKQIANQYKVSQCKVILDMIWCSIKYGSMWTEYGDLGFYARSSQNRDTYITTFYNFKLYKKMNMESYRSVFHNKIIFLETFSDFVNRVWIKTDSCSDEEIKSFLKSYNNVVVKASYGDSGKEVEVLNLSNNDNLDEVVKHIKSCRYNLIEEQIFNCDEIRKLNPSSLNTIRIVTVKKADDVSVLFAGIRVGGKGAKIDNISQGGRVARIDLVTGKINSPFYVKISSHGSFLDEDDINVVDYQIPAWDQVINTVKKAAMIVPQIRIVAWDVAITVDGIELVEGNESYGSVIMQLYYSHTEKGIKPDLIRILEKI